MPAVTVTTDPTKLCGPGRTIIQNLGAVPVYFLVGNQGAEVAVATGVELAPDGNITVEKETWGVVASGTADVRISAT